MKTVEYKELFSDSNFNNYTVGVVFEVAGTCGELSYDSTFKEAKRWVRKKLKEECSEYESLSKKIHNLRMETFRLEAIHKKQMLAIRYQEKTLRDLGMPEYSDIPF